jgi:biotin carboxyl carrier protein
MILRVKVGDHEYEVEIEDLNASPVIAVVDGERYEVYPGGSSVPESAPVPAQVEASADPLVRAPMPGVITAIAVKPGQQVARGADLCVLEAMKMKNNIRASRLGTISAIHVSLGQQVQYRDILIEFQV